MGATLTQQRRVEEDVFRDVNSFCGGRRRRPNGRKCLTVPQEKGPANYVPAAAVKRRGRALSGITGRKARAGGVASGT